MKFTERFNECLKYAQIKQNDIAKYCNTSRQNITNFKAGRSYPSIETLYLMCQCLDVSADYLLGLEDETGTKISGSKYSIGVINNSGNIDMK